MKPKKNQYTPLPNDMTKNKTLTPKDLLVYLYIKAHKNKDTKKAFPSFRTLSEESGASINTLRECVKNLELAGKIIITKKGRQNIYTFPDFDDGFEPFSCKFLYKKDLTFSEKAQLVGTQQYLFKDNGKGILQYSNRKMAELLNMPESTFRKNVNSLTEKGYIETETSIDAFTGLPTTKKIYNLTKLEQTIIFILKNHEDRLTKQEKEFQEFKDFILDNPQVREKFEKFKSTNLNTI